jgi:tRNA nucleotidyltransferase (CCA-adding enzyme)
MSEREANSAPVPLLSPDVQEILEKLMEIFGGRRDSIWVVGGYIRDRVIGRVPRDLDLVVDFDFLPYLASEAGIQVIRRNRKYQTATLRIGNWPVDIARARIETYLQPGGKPVIQWASIQDDLNRRDFTCNSIAIGIDGAVLDPFDGLADCRDRLVRALHCCSFLDDPSRIIKALAMRRKGWRIHRETEQWLVSALAAGALAKSQKSRIDYEMSKLDDLDRRDFEQM